MTAEVVIGPVGNAPQLAPVGEGEGVFDIGGGAGIESQLRRFMVPKPDVFLLDAKGQEPVFAEILPVLEPLKVGTGLAEELALHLLKLPGAEGKVAGGDLIAERLAHLADAEGELAAGGPLDIREV